MRTPPLSLADRVLYRDGLVLVIDKPAGVPVHAGPGGGLEPASTPCASACRGRRRLPIASTATSGCLRWAAIPRRCAGSAACSARG